MARDNFEHRYIVAKLAELEGALATLDARPDALAHSEARRYLVNLTAQFTAALALYEADETTLN